MKRRRRDFLRLAAGAASLPIAPGAAWALDYPARPVHLIVGFAPGSTSDFIARLLAQGAGAALGQKFVVESKPGAVSSVAFHDVAHANNDGYTLLLLALGTLTSQISKSAAPLDIDKEFAPVAMIAGGPFILVVNPGTNLHTLADLIAFAKSKPGGVFYGSVGPGSVPDLTTELFARQAAIKMIAVPYPGSPPIINDLIAGRITMGFVAASDAIGQVASGKLRALATTAKKRLTVLADVPTLGDAGMSGLESEFWAALVAPAGTPPSVIDRLAKATRTAMHEPRTLSALSKIGYETLDAGPDQTEAFIRAEITRWSAVAHSIQAKPSHS